MEIGSRILNRPCIVVYAPTATGKKLMGNDAAMRIALVATVVVSVVTVSFVIAALLRVPRPTSSAEFYIAAVMKRPSSLPRWLAHHRRMGVTHFYLRFGISLPRL
jgi:hypothetical protein